MESNAEAWQRVREVSEGRLRMINRLQREQLEDRALIADLRKQLAAHEDPS